MTSWVHVVISAALAACSSRTPGERERALERIPATAQLILAADGTALATPAFRRVIDSLTPHVPPSLRCVLEAATTSEALAVGSRPDGTTIILTTRATIASCAVLSQIGEHLWVATIGAGAVASSRAESMLAAPTWERARPYLLREPLAVGAELPALRLVAVAQPEPLDAWLAIDAEDGLAVERQIKGMLDSWNKPATIALAGKLKLERTGTQVAVQVDALAVEDLVTILVDTVRKIESPRGQPPAPFTCPPPGDGIISCHDGTQYKVTSVAALLLELASIDSTPVIGGGEIIGIRMVGQPKHLLQRDDVLLGVDGHRISDRRQLEALSVHANGHAALAVRRDGVETVIDLSE